MAEEKKERKIVSASELKKTDSKTVTNGKKIVQARPVGNALALRVGAVICWLLAIACEVVGFLAYFGRMNITFAPDLAVVIGVIVLDLLFVIIGSLLWKRANRIDPASSKNKVKFFLWNNMGVIVCIIAFLPYIILLLSDKKNKLDKKTQAIAVIVAVIALLIGGLVSYTWDAVDQEGLQSATQQIEGNVYWAKYGNVYHIFEDCHHLDRSKTIVVGSVEEAFDSNKKRLCKTCLSKWNKMYPDNQISEEVATDE